MALSAAFLFSTQRVAQNSKGNSRQLVTDIKSTLLARLSCIICHSTLTIFFKFHEDAILPV